MNHWIGKTSLTILLSTFILTGCGPSKDEITPTATNHPLGFGWEFNDEGDTGGWGASEWDTGGIEGIVVADGFLVMESIGTDPMIYIRNLRFDVSQIVEIEIRMRVSAGTSGQLFFSTEENEISEAQSFHIRVQPGDEFVSYRINTQFNNLWSGIVTELRLDPTSAISEIEIDYIRLIIE